MANLDIRALPRQGAALAREHRVENRKLVLIHCGVIAALCLGTSALHLVLDSRMGTTGGLDGMGLRMVLQTLQEFMGTVRLLFGPFWSAGFLYAMIRMVRGEGTSHGDLLEGFRRFGRLLSSSLYQTMLTISAALFLSMVSTLLVRLLPLANAGTVIPQLGITLGEILDLGIWMVLYIVFCVYLSYCFRLGAYLMMERKIGGVPALFLSRYLMRGHKMQLLKLDLRFWWFYVLNALVAAVSYLDLLPELLGFEVPVSQNVLLLATLALYCVLLTALYLWKKCDVEAAYILAFEAIVHPPEDALAETE